MMWRRSLYLAASLMSAALAAEGLPSPEPEPLPEPLTLAAALARAEAHPALVSAQADVALAAARQAGVAASNTWSLDFEARLRTIDPSPVATDQSQADHQLGLRLGKTLYDFGRSDAAAQAAQARHVGADYALVDARNTQRLAVIERFLAVITADLADASLNEAMAVSFVELDRLRQRRELGQVNPVDLLAKEAAYQTLRADRVRAQYAQQAARVRLALTLNHQGALPVTLTAPSLAVLQRPLPELADWLAQAAQANPQLRALQARLDASVAAKTAARAATQPTLRGELEAYAYTKDLSGRDELRASLVLQVPLVTGGRVDAAVAEREAERQTALAQLHQQQLAVRQALTEHWLAIQGLRAEQTALQTGMTYRDLYLDRSRARYEQEVQADLGDAMVQISAQQLRLAQNEYAQLLTWARIDALLGKTALDPAQMGEAEHESAK